MSNTTAVITQVQPTLPKTVRELIRDDTFRKELKPGLQYKESIDRFLNILQTATIREPKLLNCTPRSFYLAARELSKLGLDPDGRRAHLIPYKNTKKNVLEVQLIVDYKGIAELVRRSGEVSTIHADAVYPNDEFSYAYGSGAYLKHVPPFTNRGDKPIGFYSFVKLKNGTEEFNVMSKDDVDKIRARSRAKDSGPWVTDYDAMGMKTVFRRHSKWLPFSADVRRAIEADDEEDNPVTLNMGAFVDDPEDPQAAAEPPAKSLRDKVLSQPSFLEPQPTDPEPVTE